MTDRVKDEDQNCLFIQLWQEQIVMKISHRFYHLIQMATAIKHINMIKKCITCHSCQITMKAADFSLRLCKNSVHLCTIQTMIWLVCLFVCGLVCWLFVHLTMWSLAKIYTVLVADVSRDQCWNDTDGGKLQQVEINMSPLPLSLTAY
jgi:hypothetical protein